MAIALGGGGVALGEYFGPNKTGGGGGADRVGPQKGTAVTRRISRDAVIRGLYMDSSGRSSFLCSNRFYPPIGRAVKRGSHFLQGAGARLSSASVRWPSFKCLLRMKSLV